MAKNFKAEIAEALFEPSVKLSKEALLWAMSNLPDGENNGEFTSSIGSSKHPFTFNHEAENVWEAIGLTKPELEEVAGVMSRETKKVIRDGEKVSLIVERLFDKLWNDPRFIAIVTVKVVQDAVEEAMKMSKMLDKLQESSEGSDMEQLMAMMKLLKKLKGKGDSDD
jgi:hypothetical protein